MAKQAERSNMMSATRNSFDSQDPFWHGPYFQQELLPSVAKMLLADASELYQLFHGIKKHVDKAEAKLAETTNETESMITGASITGLFGSFCPIFFENIGRIHNKSGFWSNAFPGDWKITTSNAQKEVPQIILHEFVQWAPQQIFEEIEYNKELSELIGGLFPNVHHSLFPSFLILFFSGNINSAIRAKPNVILGKTPVWSGQKSDAEFYQMLRDQEQSQRKETIDVIIKYFRQYWEKLNFYWHDMSTEESASWAGYSETQKEQVGDRVRKAKLQKILVELEESHDIKKLCEESEQHASQRNSFIDLIQLLLAR